MSSCPSPGLPPPPPLEARSAAEGQLLTSDLDPGPGYCEETDKITNIEDNKYNGQGQQHPVIDDDSRHDCLCVVFSGVFSVILSLIILLPSLYLLLR